MATARRTSEFVDFPDYSLVAYVRDGRFNAVAAALAVLHADGLVVAGHSGTVRRDDECNTTPTHAYERAVWRAIHGFVSPGALTARPSIDSLFNELRRRCHRLGLIHAVIPVRSFTPSRTHAGRELLDSAFRDCPWPPSPEGPNNTAARIGMPVALYGSHALKALMPDFARDSGLLSRDGTDGLDWVDPEAPGPEGRYY